MGKDTTLIDEVRAERFARLSCLTYHKLQCWARRRHSNKSRNWISRKYWRVETGYWTFTPPDGIPLYQHEATPIKRYIKVRGNKSPYDGDWIYWAKRRRQQPGVPKRVVKLLQWQNGPKLAKLSPDAR